MPIPNGIILPDPLKSDKIKLKVEKPAENIGPQSNILSLPSNVTEDFIAFSDIPIMKVETVNDCFDNNYCSEETVKSVSTEVDVEANGQINLVQKTSKPKGSAYISIKMSIGSSKQMINTDVCVDTGADFTLCDSAFLQSHFGVNALQHIFQPEKVPKLRSASGHELKILGKVKLTLYLGEYELKLRVLVHKGTTGMFLLGSDSFYNRLIYDRGMFLAFANNEYPPIPIHYELVKKLVKAVCQYQVAPRSNALIQVKVTDSAQFTGKEVLLTPLNEHGERSNYQTWNINSISMCDETPVRNTVSVIDSQGNSFVLIENDTDDILTILPDVEIANAELISEDNGNINIVHTEIDKETTISINKNGLWPISALKNELIDKIPSNVIIQWENLKVDNSDCNFKESEPQPLIHNINYVHDKEERKNLLDGQGEGFPTPPSADSVHPDQDLDTDPEAWLKNVEHEHLSDSDWIKLKAILLQNKDAFSKSKTEIGCCNYFKVDLPLKPGTGYLYNKPRPLPFKHREMASETISELLAKGVIRPSKSPHATNIVCVKKKTMNGVISHRICCDLRSVNANSVPNRFPNYWIEDAMAKIQGAAFRTALDFKDAFHMLVLTEESIPVTAFYFNNVLFEYVRVPFGHVCAMNAFCCLMALLCVGYEPSSYYADDLMITTKTDHQLTRDQLFDLHLQHIAGMLERIVQAGLKLVAHKCQWCYDSNKPMEWLGFTMENNLLKPQESKVKAMKEFPIPNTGKQVISFISTASFYRRFIKNFAKEVQPMFNAAYKEPFKWTEEAQISFDKVKDIMCSDLILRLPRQGEPFQIYSDASAGALGVVLCQIDPIDKKSHPCAYGSRKFNECELKLSIPCKELLAIVYGLNLWSFYICGNPIQVFSDCRAWTFLKMQSGASGKVSRLALLVSEYDISISYVKGTLNKAADGLSRAHDDGLVKYDDLITARHPALELLTAPEMQEGEILKLNDYLVKCDDYLSEHWPKILKEYEAQQIASGKTTDLKNLKLRSDNVQQKLSNFDKELLKETEYVNQVIQESAILHIDRSKTVNWNQRFGKNKIYPFQVDNDYISEGFETLSIDEVNLSDSDGELSDDEMNKTTDSSFRTACYNIRLIAINESCFSIPAFMELQSEDEFCSRKIELIKKKDSRAKNSGFFLKRNILMRQMQTRDSQFYNVICVPQKIVKPLLESSHRSLLSGHFGSSRYLLNMSRKYYWPRMKDDILDFHHSCLPCQYNDKYPIKYSSGFVIRPLWPMHIVHCDLIVGLPRALDGSYAILLLYDGFSRLTFGIPLSSEKADYVVKKLMSHFVAAFGLPWALHSDNGRNVDGSLIRHLALMLGVLKTSTPPHTPNANPTETMCGAVGMLLRKALNESDKRYWSLCLPFILNALNSTAHTATGYTPNSLFFGKYQERDPVPLIPFDAESANVNEYFQKMRRFQELAFQIVRSRNERKLLARKVTWDATAKTHSFKEGDFVLVKNNNPASGPGKMKLRAKYIGPFRVIKAYTSSLIVVPWTQNSRLEEYYRDPNVFRLMHRGDIKPFYTRQVAVKHCKPFRGEIETEQIIDPIMLTRFLDMLGVDSQDEIISEIDPDSKSSTTTDSDKMSAPRKPKLPNARKRDKSPPKDLDSDSGSSSSNSDPDDDEQPVPQQPIVVVNQPAAPIIAPAVIQEAQNPHQRVHDGPQRVPQRRVRQNVESEVHDLLADRLVDNLDVSGNDRELLRNYYRQQEALTTMSINANSHRKKVQELEQLIRSPDPGVRRQAEFELDLALDQIKLDIQDAKEEVDYYKSSTSNDDDDLESSHTEILQHSEETTSESVNPDREQENLDFDMPDLEWDNEQPLASPPGTAQEINIRMPNVSVNIRPSARSTPRRGTQTSTPKTSRIHGGIRQRDLEDWLSEVSPDHGGPEATPIVTRFGRVSKPPQRYGEVSKAQRQQEKKDLAQALELSKQESQKDSPAQRVRDMDEPEASTSAQPPVPASRKSHSSKKTKTTKK